MNQIFLLLSMYILLLTSRVSGQDVVFKCDLKDSSGREFQIWENGDILKYERKIIYSTIIKDDLQITIKFKISKPTTIYFNDYEFYVHPRDTVKITYVKKSNNNDSLLVTGKNSVYYNFDYLLKKGRTNISYPFSDVPDSTWFAYRNKLAANKSKELRILNKYVRDNNLSTSFYEQILHEIKYQYLVFQLMPNYVIGFQVGQRTLIPRQYYSNINPNDFKDALSTPLGFFTIGLYNKFITDSRTNNILDRYSDQYLVELFNSASLIDIKSLREALYANLLKDYQITNDHSYLNAYRNVYKKARLQLVNTSNIKYIDSLFNVYDSVDKVFPREVLNTTLLDMNGNILTFKDILEKYQSNIIYCDFWASWCVPCREEIPYSISMKNKLKDSKVVFLYFSLDSKFMKETWMNASNELGTVDNQYLVIGDFKASLSQFINVGAIPKYFIIDKKSKLISKNPLPPSNPELESILRTLSEK